MWSGVSLTAPCTTSPGYPASRSRIKAPRPGCAAPLRISSASAHQTSATQSRAGGAGHGYAAPAPGTGMHPLSRYAGTSPGTPCPYPPRTHRQPASLSLSSWGASPYYPSRRIRTLHGNPLSRSSSPFPPPPETEKEPIAQPLSHSSWFQQNSLPPSPCNVWTPCPVHLLQCFKTSDVPAARLF